MAFDLRKGLHALLRSAASRAEPTPRRPDPEPFIRAVLGDDLARRESWRHSDTQLQQLSGDYYEIWKQLKGGHKVYSYFEVYEKVFAPFRGQELRVLEIGVYHGASLQAWRSYLGPRATIVGIDINPACRKSEQPEHGIHVRIGDQSDPAFLAAVVAEHGPFDLIMDDGSHVTDHQLKSFRALFEPGLRAKGIYFIEDICTSFWSSYCEGPHDMLDLAHACALGLNHFYWDHDYAQFVRERQPTPFQALRINRLIEEVRIFDSAIAIYKAAEGRNPPLVIHN
jgi:hypothetical protein